MANCESTNCESGWGMCQDEKDVYPERAGHQNSADEGIRRICALRGLVKLQELRTVATSARWYRDKSCMVQAEHHCPHTHTQ